MGIKALSDISDLLPKSEFDNGYYVVTVDNPTAVAKIINDLVHSGVGLTEVRELDNPLQEFFEGE